MKPLHVVTLLMAAASGIVGLWAGQGASATSSPPFRPPRAVGLGHAPPISPLSEPMGLDGEQVELGRRLFHDPRLSADGTVSCASCHDLSSGGDDGRSRSVGVGGATGATNAPTVYNSGLNPRQFWDGRATSLEDQVNGPVQHPKEMGSRWEDVVARLRADTALESRFRAAFDDGLTPGTIRSAIAEFERSLVTTGSPFDRYLAGEAGAISPEAEHGYQLFLSYGCVSCHQGANVGGNMFQTLGVIGDWFLDRGTPATEADLGRFNVTGREADRHVFRVPSLRMASHTAPYFHDGSVATLDEAIAIMGRYQLGRDIGPSDRADIRAFLVTLNPMPGADDAP